jgi:hypothetical protein
MRNRSAVGLAILMAAVIVAISWGERVVGQDSGKKAAETKFLYGSNLRVRQGGKPDFDKSTPWVGVEVYQDEATNTIIGISEVGDLAAFPAAQVTPDGVARFTLTEQVLEALKSESVPEALLAKFAPLKDKEMMHDEFVKEISKLLSGDEKERWMRSILNYAEKLDKWLTANDLSARKAGEAEFTQKTKKFGVELFRDLRSNKLLYVCETGSIAFAPVPAELVTDRGPKWHHAHELKVRGAEQKNFDNAKKIGLEVFKDENTGDLIYITQSGGIATSPAPKTAPDAKKIAPPKWAYGWDLRVRTTNEPNFNDKTKHIGVEVFEDPNADDRLLYITEEGFIATAPNTGKFLDGKGVLWKTGMGLKARKSDEKFDVAKRYHIEVFVDNRTGNLIFISETGSIAVVAKQ